METVKLSPGELVKLCSIDSQLYARTFFPNAFRRASPAFHKKIWLDLEDPKIRLLNERIFRGGAKTTIARTFTSKRIAYGMSKTILYIGASESSALRSTMWIRSAVERNHLWAGTFSLVPGRKWQENEFEILNKTTGQVVWVLGVGITGNVRGINFDDYRPGLIVLDDVLTDENCLTEEQRNKVSNLVLGALKESLAPRVDEPNAKLVALNTTQHPDDFTAKAEFDPEWTTMTHACWTPETLDAPLDEQMSAWEEQLPTAQLRKDKALALAANRLSTWVRENECRLISAETASFKPQWLNYYDVKPQGTYNVLVIDPVPPPSARQMSKNLKGKDYEAIEVWGKKAGDYYLLEYIQSKGHNPSWTIAKTFELAAKYRVAKLIVEEIAYQQVLKWILERAMQERGIYWSIFPWERRGRSKFTCIVSSYHGPASQGHVFIGRNMTEFATQFVSYGPTYADVDDLLDAGATALEDLQNSGMESIPIPDLSDDHIIPIKRRFAVP